MTDYIDSLVRRFSGEDNMITPRLSGRFEPSYPDHLNPVDESTIEYETTPVSNQMNNTPSLKNTGLRSSDNNKYYNYQLRKDENNNYPPNEKQKPVTINPVNNEVSFDSPQQVNNSFIETFIQPSVVNNYSLLNSQIETKNDLKEMSSSGIKDTAMNNGFLDLQLEEAKQRNKVDRNQSFQVGSEQYSMMNKEIIHPEFHEYSQNNKPPVIKISIGRIEVRAVPASNGVKAKDSLPQKPKLTLDEYLQKRNSGQ